MNISIMGDAPGHAAHTQAPTSSQGRQTELTKSLSRALSILDILLQKGTPLGVTELAQSVGIHKSSVYRLLRTMVEFEILEQHPQTSKYWLGPKLALLGEAAYSHLELPRIAAPHVERLAQLTRETANFAKLLGGTCLYLVSVPSDQPIGMMARPYGSTDPIYSTALGKAMLAYMPSTRAKTLLKNVNFTRRTERTPTCAEEVLAQLETVRERGYATDIGETHEHTRCVGAAVFDARGDVIGALSVSGPEFRMPAERISECGALVIQAAVEISASLGLEPAQNPLSKFASPSDKSPRQ